MSNLAFFICFQSTGLFRHKGQNKCVEVGAKLELKRCDKQQPKQQFEINEIKTW